MRNYDAPLHPRIKRMVREEVSSILYDDETEFRRCELLGIIRDIYDKGRKDEFISGKDRMRIIRKIEALCEVY